jgi:uncharacterized protein (TIGR01777 family)
VKTVAITGATGTIGRVLVERLLARGDKVVAFSRDFDRASKLLGNQPDDRLDVVEAYLEGEGTWQQRLADADAVVHLAGEPIAGKRWDARQKQVVRDSRVESTRLVVEGIASLEPALRPTVLVCASGADYYDWVDESFDDEEEFDERAPAGETFLGRVCKAWEDEAARAESLGVRVVRMRTGVVLGPGGALDRMTTPFKLFVGGKIGRGTQWMAWIHQDDVIAAYLAAVDDERFDGPINLVAPEPARARDVARAVGKALHRPSWLPVPGFAVRAAVGELADYLLAGRKVVPRALERLGFAFAHPHLEEAVAAALTPARSSRGRS